MPEFLNLVPPAVALQTWLSALPPVHPPTETIPSADALGRVLAEDVLARELSPAFDRSTVDGYAVRAADTFGASEPQPAYLRVVGEVVMGRAAEIAPGPAEAVIIHTGGMVPPGADAVVMLEQTQLLPGGGELEVLRAVAPGENVIRAGEDARPGQMVIPRGTRLRPAEIGALMALGLTRVRVARAPRVGLISSGDEVIPPDGTPAPGQVRDVNSYTLAALVRQAGGEPVQYGILPDDFAALQAAATRALAETDMLALTAGSSASVRDLTAGVIQSLGAPGVLVHGVNMRPGKPTILAICDGKPVIGMPGNPVSAVNAGRLFAVPMIERLIGLRPRPRGRLVARLTVNIPSQAGREDWVGVRLSRMAEGWLAEPIFARSNLILSLAAADGLVCVPADETGLPAGVEVPVELF